MIDSNSQFFAILTAVGEAKQANAMALGTPWTFKEMAVGDANGTDPIPNRAQTKLISEWRRAPANQVRTDPANPNIIITEQVIPSDVGGRWIREIGLFDADGDLVAVANCAPSFKPLLAQGTGKTQVIRMNFIVANTAQIVLKIDPAVVLATRKYVDDSFASVLPADKGGGTYRQVTIDKRGIVVSGINPTTLSGYGITDAFTKAETSSAIQASKESLVASAPVAFDTLKKLADALGNDPKFATTIAAALAGKANSSTTLAGYSINDAYTKIEVNAKLQAKADNATTLAGYGITDAYAKTVTYSRTEVDNALARKATSASTLAGYGIVDAYNRSETNGLLFGQDQSLYDLTGSRALDTTYINTTGKPIIVRVAAKQTTNSGSGVFIATVAGNELSGTSTFGSGQPFCNEFIVGPGETYSVKFGGTTYSMLSWKERR